MKLGQRFGDGAEVAILELVDYNTGAPPTKKETKAKEAKEEAKKRREKKKKEIPTGEVAHEK